MTSVPNGNAMFADAPKAPVLAWTLAGLTALALYVCWPLWPALLLSAWTAGLVRPLLVWLERVLRGRRRAAGVLSVVLFLILLLPLGAIVLGVVSGARDLAQTITLSNSAKDALENIATGANAPPSLQFPRSMSAAIDLLQRYGTQGVGILSKVAGAAAKSLVALFIYFAGAYVFLVDGRACFHWMTRSSPLQPRHLDRFAAAFHETGRGLLIGVGLTSATQALVATLVYLAVGIPRWWVLGPITGVASMIPVVGSALVWGPVMLGLFFTGHSIRGSILAVVGVGVISTVDNVLRPIYARMGALQMPTFLLYVSIFGGIATVGTWGAILGPLIVRLWMEAIALRREDAALH